MQDVKGVSKRPARAKILSNSGLKNLLGVKLGS
jgi:hypothetical protein